MKLENHLSPAERQLALLLQDCAGRRIDEIFPVFATQARAILSSKLLTKKVKELLDA